MSGLTKRVDALERTGNRKEEKAFLLVHYPSDGGLVYGGKFYHDTDALLSSLGIEPDGAFILGWQGETMTAAELLAEAAERAKNPPPEVTLDDLGEYGRRLVEQKGVSLAVANLLEKLNPHAEVNHEQK